MAKEGTPPTFKRVIVRGNFYKGQFAKEVKKALTPHTVLIYEREPANLHDRWALKVLVDIDFLGTIDIGWVGREYAAQISPWIDSGWVFTVTFNRFMQGYPIVTFAPILSQDKSADTEVERELEVT